jgi:2,4-dienoyl-CoA reductase (NADPH2)
VGGGAVGCETALHLARNRAITPEAAFFLLENRALSEQELLKEMYCGREVILLEMLDRIGSDIGLSTRWITMQELQRSQIEVRTSTKVTELTSTGVVVQDKEGKTETVDADTVVIAVGVEPAGGGLAEELRAFVPEVITIGDAKKPRKAIEAIFEGMEAGSRI